MLRSLHYTPSFHETQGNLTRSAQSPIGGLWQTVTALRSMCDALREGLAAWRHYEHQRSRGIPHHMALREAIGFTHSRETREMVQPLCFAGKA